MFAGGFAPWPAATQPDGRFAARAIDAGAGRETPARRLIETLMTTRRLSEFVLPQDRSARPPVIEVQNWIIEQMRSDIARYRSALSPFAAHGE